jgi:3-deoxy-D-manno-octulosonic-acid transferase
VKAVVGNLKFDAQPDAGLCATGRAWRQRFGRPVALLASSREGEEAALLAALAAAYAGGGDGLIADACDLQWLIVPRHPQRFAAVAAAAEAAGWRVLRRSQWGACGPDAEAALAWGSAVAAHEATDTDADLEAGTAAEPEPARPTLWLGDSLGEMALYYSLADVALLGGSFGEYGGQNLIESAACGCPLLLGPHTYNFAEAAEGALQAGAALAVADMPAAVQAARHWCGPGAEARALAAQAALAFSQAHRGAAQRTVHGLLAAMVPP